MSDLVERLHTLSRGDHGRGCQGREYHCSCGFDEQAWKAADEAIARIEYLEKRLEVVPGWSESADGISCRDDTIKLQDAHITKLETALAEALRERTEARAEAANLRADLRQAEGRVIADVVAWLREEGTLQIDTGYDAGFYGGQGMHFAATQLENGQWKPAIRDMKDRT